MYNDLIVYKHLSIYAVTFTIFNRGLGFGCTYTESGLKAIDD